MCIYRKHKTIRVSRYIYIIAIVVVVLIIPQCYTYLCSSTRSRKFYKKTKRRKDPQGDDRRAIWMLNVLHTCIICGVMCSVQKYIARHSHLTLAMSLLPVGWACVYAAPATLHLYRKTHFPQTIYIFLRHDVCAGWYLRTRRRSTCGRRCSDLRRQ